MTREEIEKAKIIYEECKNKSIFRHQHFDITGFYVYIEDTKIDKLLDYIDQLQQENEELKAIDKAHQELVGELMCNKGMVRK